MKIRLAALKNGTNEITESVPAKALGIAAETYPRPLSVTVWAEKNGGRITIAVESSVLARFSCDRCGDEFDSLVEGECNVAYILRDEPLPDEMPGDDLRTYRAHQDEIDLSTEVRDALLLSEPLQHICNDACLGICPSCHVNLNRETCRCGRSEVSS